MAAATDSGAQTMDEECHTTAQNPHSLPEDQPRRASDTPTSHAALVPSLESAKNLSSSAKAEERTSINIRSFISGIRKSTKIVPSISDAQKVDVATCLLFDTAEPWHSRAVESGKQFR
ncbi:unnamed protein product [Agarophyton chilense]